VKQIATSCAYDGPQTHAQPHFAAGLKIRRRKACRFDSGLRHHSKINGLQQIDRRGRVIVGA